MDESHRLTRKYVAHGSLVVSLPFESQALGTKGRPFFYLFIFFLLASRLPLPSHDVESYMCCVGPPKHFLRTLEERRLLAGNVEKANATT